MNRFITAIKDLDFSAVKLLLEDPKWCGWSEPDGKNGLHYVCGLGVGAHPAKTEASLSILKLLLKSRLDIDSVHRIEQKNCDFFPATPLWYAYTRGRNAKLYKFLLRQGADPNHCMWAIAWYDDVAAAKLFIKHGAKIDERPSRNDLFLGSFQWKKFAFAKWLLAEGADVDARGPAGLTALMLAVKRKDEDSIRWLMQEGGDPDLKSENGMSARGLAEAKGPKRLLELLSTS